MIYCECNHSAPWHGLTERDAAQLQGGRAAAPCYVLGCMCRSFKEDPTYEPEERDEKTPGGPVSPGAGSTGC